MTLLIPHLWIYFRICLANVLVAQRIMVAQGKHFFYFDGARKPFNMLNLEFPKDLEYFYTVLSGIGKLETADAAIVSKNVGASSGQTLFLCPVPTWGCSWFVWPSLTAPSERLTNSSRYWPGRSSPAGSWTSLRIAICSASSASQKGLPPLFLPATAYLNY